MIIYYKNEITVINRELQALPDGHLIKKGMYYYHRINKKEISITKKPDLIIALHRKKYLLGRKAQLEQNIAAVSQSISTLDKRTQTKLIQSLPNAYQHAPPTHFYNPSALAWMEATYEKNPLPFKGRKHFSKGGTQVRSKSEILIANQLEDYGIHYRYEAALTLDGQTNYPDFEMINPYSLKHIIWEHFGAFNQHGYERSMNDKMNLYTSNGYTPFDTFIYTFEYEVGDPRRLRELIENIILGV